MHAKKVIHTHAMALGWGLLCAWGMIGMLVSTHEGDFYRPFDIGLLPTAANVIALACALGFALHKADFLLQNLSRFSDFATAFMVAGSIGHLLGRSHDGGTPAMGEASLAVASAGYVMLLLSWGRYYAALDERDIENFAAGSILVCAVTYSTGILLSLVNIFLVQLLWAALPILSFLLLSLAQRSDGKPPTASVPLSADKPFAGFVRAHLRLAIAILAISFTIAFSTSLFSLAFPGISSLSGATANVSGLFFSGFLVIYAKVHVRRIALGSFYRFMMPLLVSGLFLVSVPTAIGNFTGFSLVFATRWVLTFFIWVYLSETETARTHPLAVFAIGELVFEMGQLLGFVAGSIAVESISSLGIPLVYTAFAAATLFIAITSGCSGNLDGPLGTDNTAAGESTSADLDAALDKRIQAIADSSSLTPRETEVLRYLARGYSLPYIRNKLFIAQSTIETHAKHIYKKLGIHAREELLALIQGQAADTE